MRTTQIKFEEEIIVKRTISISISTSDIQERCVFIKISRSGKPQGMSPEALYNATRKEWRASLAHITKVDYVVAVYNNKIVEVYKPIDWFVNINNTRVSFEGILAPFEIRQKYIGLQLSSLAGVRQPIAYNFK